MMKTGMTARKISRPAIRPARSATLDDSAATAVTIDLASAFSTRRASRQIAYSNQGRTGQSAMLNPGFRYVASATLGLGYRACLRGGGCRDHPGDLDDRVRQGPSLPAPGHGFGQDTDSHGRHRS